MASNLSCDRTIMPFCFNFYLFTTTKEKSVKKNFNRIGFCVIHLPEFLRIADQRGQVMSLAYELRKR